MRSRELVLLEFTQLLNLFCSYRDASARDLSMFSKVLDSLVTDAEQVGVLRQDLCEFMLSNWLIKRNTEARARSIAEKLRHRLKESVPAS